MCVWEGGGGGGGVTASCVTSWFPEVRGVWRERGVLYADPTPRRDEGCSSINLADTSVRLRGAKDLAGVGRGPDEEFGRQPG